MVKLRLKRCGRKQRATWRTRSVVDSYIHHFIQEWRCSWLDIICFTRTLLFCWVGMEIVHDGARVEKIDSFLGDKDLGLMPINKLEQLRKYIFDIKIERVPSFQNKNFLELIKIKLFRYKVYHVGINCLICMILW